LRDKKDEFKWEVAVEYGPAQHENSERFLELSRKCERTGVPIVLGGYFNLIRGRCDKNNDNINLMLVNMFNEFIADQNMQELRRAGSKLLGQICSQILLE
jgi:hypothetical protein